MGAHSRERRVFSETDAHFLQSIVNVIGEAIERHRARTELEDRVEERTADLRKKNALVRLLQEVTRAANEAERLEEALQTAVDAICEHGMAGGARLPTRERPLRTAHFNGHLEYR